jgi:hypothetical protein
VTKKSMVESLLSLLGQLGILTNTCHALTLTREVANSRNQQEQQQDGLSNDNIQNTIKGASHSAMETQNALEIKEVPQPKGDKKSCLMDHKTNNPSIDSSLLFLGHR